MNSVIIGTHEWMTENLNVDCFLDGSFIPEAMSNEDWIKAGKECRPAWCYYDNDSEYGKKYGKLYNWYAVTDPRKLAPKDWHIPAYSEFIALVKEVNQNSNALKAVGQDDISTNAREFSALLSGGRYENACFSSLGARSAFWSSTEHDYLSAFVMYLYFEEFDIKLTNDLKEFGFTVRCTKECSFRKDSDILFRSTRLGE